MRLVFYVFLLFAVIIVGMSGPAVAATLTVTDSGDTGATGQLRQTIAAAASGDTINFSVTGFVLLTGGRIIIAKNLTISGPGAANLKISGGNSSGVFEISSGFTVVISGVEIRGGWDATGAGGGILNRGTLTLTDSAVTNCLALFGGGLYNEGTMTLINDTIGGNNTDPANTKPATAGYGGGIYSKGGPLSLTNTIITGNNAYVGGGINTFAGGTLAITDSTIQWNHAALNGGGINTEAGAGQMTISGSTIIFNSSDSNGGGLYLSTTSSMTNDTILGNFATLNGGAIYNYSGSATLTNATVNQNQNNAPQSGAVFRESGAVSVRNTILDNSFNCRGGITSLGHNIDSSNTCGFTGPGDLVNTNPRLGVIGDNGGPTQTEALLEGSPAINAADPEIYPPTDQRGVTRPQGSGPDIGAYEVEVAAAAAPAPVPTMNEWGIIIFMTVAGLGASYYLRRRKAKT